ncbi:MAG: tetratricopeptide repeat protein [Deltaproteobacteria bacterium]|nr:tetratricopeptide repeat protein [Deltaproteobacteria bacterium]
MDELDLFQQMMSKDPSSQVYVYLAEALLEREMYGEAIETCFNGLRLRPHDLRARVILGLSYLRTGELERAENELLKAKEMLEINTVTYRALAELYDEKGDLEQSGRYRQLFEAIHPPETSEAEAEVAETESKPVDEEVPEEDTEVATVTMAELYEEQGHLDKAAEVYRNILETSPETEGVEAKLADLEKRITDAKVSSTLLSILESWQSGLQERDTQEGSEPLPTSSGIDPEKLAAFVKSHIE